MASDNSDNSDNNDMEEGLARAMNLNMITNLDDNERENLLSDIANFFGINDDTGSEPIPEGGEGGNIRVVEDSNPSDENIEPADILVPEYDVNENMTHTDDYVHDDNHEDENPFVIVYK